MEGPKAKWGAGLAHLHAEGVRGEFPIAVNPVLYKGK